MASSAPTVMQRRFPFACLARVASCGSGAARGQQRQRHYPALRPATDSAFHTGRSPGLSCLGTCLPRACRCSRAGDVFACATPAPGRPRGLLLPPVAGRAQRMLLAAAMQVPPACIVVQCHAPGGAVAATAPYWAIMRMRHCQQRQRQPHTRCNPRVQSHLAHEPGDTISCRGSAGHACICMVGGPLLRPFGPINAILILARDAAASAPPKNPYSQHPLRPSIAPTRGSRCPTRHRMPAGRAPGRISFAVAVDGLGLGDTPQSPSAWVL